MAKVFAETKREERIKVGKKNKRKLKKLKSQTNEQCVKKRLGNKTEKE